MTLVDAVRYFHISAGLTAFLSLFLPMFLPKGGKAHRRVGWVFVIAMSLICVSSVPLALHRLITDSNRGRRIGAAFLLYISILSFNAVWHGIRVLRSKGTGANRSRLDLGMAGLLAASGIATIGIGLYFATPLLVLFGVVGVSTGLGQIRTLRNPNKERMHWWFGHMGGMMSASIAALTAALVVNAPRLGLGNFSLIVWLLPTSILTPVTIIWTRYYRQKFGLAKTTAKTAVKATPAAAPIKMAA